MADLEIIGLENESTRKRNDLDRFLKFFIIKSVQVIVQSRINANKRICTPCSLPNSSKSDWFNLSIEDEDRILFLTRDALKSGLCSIEVEIYLESANERLLLENWSIDLNSSNTNEPVVLVENNTRLIYNVYNRMSLMLKSLLSISRVTPAYKIAKKQQQQSDEFNISYEIMRKDEDNIKELGDRTKVIDVGTVSFGLEETLMEVGVRLSYRTRMEFEPSSSLFIKSDHYGEQVKKTSMKPAFLDSSEEIKHDDDDEEFITGVPFGQLFLSCKEKLSSKQDFVFVSKPIIAAIEEDGIKAEVGKAVVSKDCSSSRETESRSNPMSLFPFARSSESDLLSMFEEFRVAPTTLGSFHADDNEQENLETFESDLLFYDDFVKKLCEK